MLFHEPLVIRKSCQLLHDTTLSCQLIVRNILISEMLKCKENVHLRINELECKEKIHLSQLPSLGRFCTSGKQSFPSIPSFTEHKPQQNLHDLLTLETARSPGSQGEGGCPLLTRRGWSRRSGLDASSPLAQAGVILQPYSMCVYKPGLLTELLIFTLWDSDSSP